jgi:hypothetical protein
MSRERDFLDLARVNLRLAARAVKLAHEENPDRGSLSDIERDIMRSRDSCSYLIEIIGSERTS